MLHLLVFVFLIQDVAPTSMDEVREAVEPFVLREPASSREKRRVARDLRQRAEADQKLRRRYVELLSEPDREEVEPRLGQLRQTILETDRENTEALKGYAETYGWFPRSVWDWLPGWNAWTIVQHADGDPGFQARVLVTMEPLVDRGEVGIKNYAYLYDRVARNHDVPQRYATQGRCLSPGVWEPLPLEEPAEVDRLRNEAGLEPLEDYAVYEAKKCGGR